MPPEGDGRLVFMPTGARPQAALPNVAPRAGTPGSRGHCPSPLFTPNTKASQAIWASAVHVAVELACAGGLCTAATEGSRVARPYAVQCATGDRLIREGSTSAVLEKWSTRVGTRWLLAGRVESRSGPWRSSMHAKRKGSIRTLVRWRTSVECPRTGKSHQVGVTGWTMYHAPTSSLAGHEQTGSRVGRKGRQEGPGRFVDWDYAFAPAEETAWGT